MMMMLPLKYNKFLFFISLIKKFLKENEKQRGPVGASYKNEKYNKQTNKILLSFVPSIKQIRSLHPTPTPLRLTVLKLRV